MPLGRLIRNFFSLNKKACTAIEQMVRGDRPSISLEYNQLCAGLINDNPERTVLDIGAGKRLIYSDLLTRNELNIIGCDVDENEIAQNPGIRSAIVCDASKEITLPDDSVDLITSHYCVEHLPDVRRFIRECNRVLKPGGQFCFIFAAKLSLHAVLNQTIPHEISRKVLYFFMPGSHVTAGFKAYYDQGTYNAFSKLLKEEGYEITLARSRYGSRGYFMFFLPLYLFVAVTDVLITGIANPDWASDYIFIARKSPQVSLLQDNLTDIHSRIL